MGVMMLVRSDGTTKTETMRRAPRLQDMQAMVGGPIENVPHVSHKSVDESSPKVLVVAYSNEDGKRLGLPTNELATKMWRKSNPPQNDVLRGDVLFFWGDATFMRSL